LYYFPQKGEEIIEDFSIKAGVISESEEYLSFVSDFLRDYENASLFEIGNLFLSFSSTNNTMICSLKSTQNLKSFVSKDILVENLENESYLIKKGEIDQNLASFDISLSFFKVLTATLTYNFGQGPSSMNHRLTSESSSSIQNEEIHLSYGTADLIAFLNKWLPFLAEKQKIINNWNAPTNYPEKFKNELWWNVHKHKHYTQVDKASLGIDERPQFIILSGFLGSGKTTFLKQFIEYHIQNNRFVAVIQNEIGEKGLDTSLLEDNYAVLEMDEGCVCCSLVGQVQKGILEIIKNHRPDVIVLETTGLANPYNLLSELDEINHLIRFDSVTTMIDAANYNTSKNQSKIVNEQLKAANIILLNKIDLITESESKNLQKHISTINPKAVIHSCAFGNINPAYLNKVDECDFPEIIPNENHHHTHKEDGYASKRLIINHPLNKSLFISTLKSLANSIYRLKGIIEFEGDQSLSVIQFVNGDYKIDSLLTNKNINEHFLVLIGKQNSLDNINNTFFN